MVFSVELQQSGGGGDDAGNQESTRRVAHRLFLKLESSISFESHIHNTEAPGGSYHIDCNGSRGLARSGT